MNKKFFNEKHEVILNARIVNVGNTTGLKHGDLIESKHVVDGVKYYQQRFDQFGNHAGYDLVWISNEKITDLYNQIQKIESESFMAKLDTLPF